MSKKIKHRPNYAKIYPNVEINPEISDVMEKSDMRMEYDESHRKRERVHKNENGDAIVLPSYEDSLERLIEIGKQFSDNKLPPEQMFIENVTITELYHCLDLLDDDERALINALFFDELTERQYSAKSGLSKSAVNRHKQQILDKLNVFLKNIQF
jgi:RNA polymerase sigma factor (sigma-70 family)